MTIFADHQAWVYISKLNHSITLLSCSQAAAKHPFFQLKILENSLISVASTVYNPSSAADETPPEEIICQAPDALIAHGQWVHFAVNCRHTKGQETGEIRLYVNGVRVGVMKINYPVPVPPAPATAPHQLGQRANVAPEAIRMAVAREWEGGVTQTGQGSGPQEAPHLTGRMEENEWLLGRVLMTEEAIAEDLILLLHHLVSL